MKPQNCIEILSKIRKFRIACSIGKQLTLVNLYALNDGIPVSLTKYLAP